MMLQMLDIFNGSCREVINDMDLIPEAKKQFRQMRPDKTGPSGDQHFIFVPVCHFKPPFLSHCPTKTLRPAGLEPAAYWFEASRSIRLSYGRKNPCKIPRARL